jgi:hypothetical protein
MSIWLPVFLAFVALLAVIAVRGLRPASDQDVDGWIDGRDLDAGAEGRALARVYLSWVRPWRSAGLLFGLAPFLKWILYDRMDQAGPWAALWLGFSIVGYLVGCSIAEITFTGTFRTAHGEAELRPRELGAYLSGSPVIVLWGVAVLAVLSVPAYLVVVDPARMGDRLGGVIWSSVLVIVTAAAVRWVMGRIVDRPRAVTSSELIRVDHAERSASLRTVVMAGIALELLVISFSVSEIGRALEARTQHGYMEPASWLAAGVVVLAVLVWLGGVSGRTPPSLVRRAGP